MIIITLLADDFIVASLFSVFVSVQLARRRAISRGDAGGCAGRAAHATRANFPVASISIAGFVGLDYVFFLSLFPVVFSSSEVQGDTLDRHASFASPPA
jgi:hypothetical protein